MLVRNPWVILVRSDTVEEDEAFDLADVSLLGLITVLPGTDRLPDLVK